MAKILLNMIVKNEANIITRLLNSVENIIDGLVICDTGSSDDTVITIQNWALSKGIPHEIVQDKWINFGVNRTNAIGYAKSFLHKTGNHLNDWYLMFIDADMQLIIDPSFDKNTLTEAAYMLKQSHDGGLEYFNIRMIRANIDSKYIGPTHEYLDINNESRHILDSVKIYDIGDGGSKADKFERDIKLLTETLELEPDNPRYVFYLANSYFDIGNYNSAKQFYQTRYSLNGWDEEKWYAKYKWGVCLIELSQIKDAEDILIEAFQERPWRAEPVFKLAEFYHKKDDHVRAFMYASMAIKVKSTKEDQLFIDKNANGGNGPEDIASVHAYYIGFFAEGRKFTEQLIAAYPNVQRHIDNLQFYIDAQAKS